MPPSGLHIGYPPGLAPDKWLRRMAERFPSTSVETTLLDVAEAQLARAPHLLASGFDVVFVREPADAPRSAPPGLARIPLHDEAQAVLVPKDHEASLFPSLTSAALEGERWVDAVDPLTASSADVAAHVELVAANVGLGRLPLPLARAHSRRDVVVVPLEEPAVTRLGIAWLPERGEEEALAGFVGIVRGRTANTSRGSEANPGGDERRGRATSGREVRGDAGGTTRGGRRPEGRSRGAGGRGGRGRGGGHGGGRGGRGRR